MCVDRNVAERLPRLLVVTVAAKTVPMFCNRSEAVRHITRVMSMTWKAKMVRLSNKHGLCRVYKAVTSMITDWFHSNLRTLRSHHAGVRSTGITITSIVQVLHCESVLARGKIAKFARTQPRRKTSALSCGSQCTDEAWVGVPWITPCVTIARNIAERTIP